VWSNGSPRSKKEEEMTDNKWGKPGDWKVFNTGHVWNKCDECGVRGFPGDCFSRDGVHLCSSCYQTHVVEPSEGVECGMNYCHNPITPTPELEPLKEWDPSLVGKRVVCIDPEVVSLVYKTEYIIKGKYVAHKPGVTLEGCSGFYFLERFALSPSQPGQEEGEMKISGITNVEVDAQQMKYALEGKYRTVHKIAEYMNQKQDGNHYEVRGGNQIQVSGVIKNVEVEISWGTDPQPIIEETFTASSLFGKEGFKIPNPGDDWKYADCILSQEKVKRIYVDDDGSVDVILSGESSDLYIKPQLEQAVWFKEYENRINAEQPPIAIHRWTREPIIQEKYKCLENYPLLNKGVK
jgi:hypothetical protein